MSPLAESLAKLARRAVSAHLRSAHIRGKATLSDIFERLRSALQDRYAVEREVGSGGMATVYLAEDLKHHRKVAVKVLRPDIAATLGSERFLREIQVAAQLQHPPHPPAPRFG